MLAAYNPISPATGAHFVLILSRFSGVLVPVGTAIMVGCASIVVSASPPRT
jgi:hypothetical protein